MKKQQLAFGLLAGCLSIPSTLQADVASGEFGYQGQLKLDGVPVTDTCDFEFSLWSDPASELAEDQIGPILTFDGVVPNPAPLDVTSGLFHVLLDFGPTAFADDPRWLEVAVRCPAGVDAYVTLVPRQQISGVPFAIHTRGIQVDESGAVGIGVPAPEERLHVAGSIALVGDGADPYIELRSDDVGGTVMRLTSIDGVGFGVTDDRDDPMMVVTERGLVGVGTERPEAQLHVEGRERTLVQVGNSDTVVVVTGEGNVGIGDNDPNAALLVSGTRPDTLVNVKGVANTLVGIEGTGKTLLQVQGDANGPVLEVRGAGRSYGQHIALFDSTGTPLADGIAIRLDNDHTNRENNFVTFLNGQDIVAGRIEGFDLENGDWIAPPPLPDVGMTFDPAISYDARWFSPGSLPTVDFDPGSRPSLQFQWDLPSLTFHAGTNPSLNVTAGTLPTANFNAGTSPTLDFDDGSLPDFDATNCEVLNVDVMCGFSWSAGSTPTASLTGGSLPSLSFTPGSLPVVNLNPGTLPSVDFDPGSIPAVNWSRGELPALTFTGGSLPRVLSPPIVFGDPTLTFDLPTQAELDALYCWAFETGNSDLITFDPAGYAVASLRQSVAARCKDEGVTYGSKGADYAEWLPKLDPSDKFQIGQIVGIRGGKVSLNTEGAEQIMAISRAPVVVGNVPPENEKHNYVTVGFMGQLPVVVRGKANAGDYIIPSGLEDGTAIAVAPEELKLEHMGRTLGRAWSESDNEVYSLITVAIGLDGYEAKTILRRQQDQLGAQEDTLRNLRAENIRLNAGMAAMAAQLAELTASVQNMEALGQGQRECQRSVALSAASR